MTRASSSLSRQSPARRPPARPAARSNKSPARASTTGPAPIPYLEASERPGTSLIFLAPLILLYELYAAGVIAVGSPGALRADLHITAFLLIESLFRLLGAAGRHLPAIALVGMLLAAHIARQDRWRFHPGTLFGMAIESIGWAIPLLVLGWVAARHVPMAAGADANRLAVLCVGAGLYEEMVFRLILVTALSLVLRDLMGVPRNPALVVVLLTSGLLFALYHYLSPGEDFRLRTCVFRTAAGAYFGALFMVRGFGITAACHATYDLIVVGLLTP